MYAHLLGTFRAQIMPLLRTIYMGTDCKERWFVCFNAQVAQLFTCHSSDSTLKHSRL
jgi:hypothetical protein